MFNLPTQLALSVGKLQVLGKNNDIFENQKMSHEEMRQAGFYIKTVKETCEHFAIIDQKIVWYGSLNL